MRLVSSFGKASWANGGKLACVRGALQFSSGAAGTIFLTDVII
jgi:hypothetical protein